MNDPKQQFEKRKKDHVDLALLAVNQAVEHNTFDRFTLLHEALPDCDFDDLSLASTRFGNTVLKPFIVSSMTAGHHQAKQINAHLMEACSKSGWAMGVGSQRRELFDKEAALDWVDLIQAFPEVTVFSNIGIAQAIHAPFEAIKQLTETIQAKALIVHCNPLQEVIQPEGTPQFRGAWDKLAQLVADLGLPVVVKETGCGFSEKTLKHLDQIGVAAVDVAGLGGTHWGRIEGLRASADDKRSKTAETFKNWGIDTVTAVKTAQGLHPQFEIWGSGGVRNGLDAAKLFALGATTVGFAKPLLAAALISSDTVLAVMETIEYELQVALFCTGSQGLSDLKRAVCQ